MCLQGSGIDLTYELVYGGTWAALCSSAVPCALPLSGARSVLMCSCHAPRISTICVKNKQWFHWDCAESIHYRTGLVVRSPLCSSLCRSSMTTSAIWHFVSWLYLCTEGPYLLLSPCHICGLFCIEWVSDASHHKNIQLQLLFTVFFLSLQLLQVFFLLASGWRARAGRACTAAAAAGRQSTRALAGPAWRYAWSSLGGHCLFAFLLHYPIRFLLAGRRV